MSGEVRSVLALALGRPVGVESVSWARILTVAEQERCAPLAWLRSSAQIRHLAPPDVVHRWRAAALAAVDIADLWEEVLGRVVGSLRAAGVDAIVLKGLPLAERLYGTASARPCADLDLFIPHEQRPATHRALIDSGWRWRRGMAPQEGGYETVHAGRAVLVEVHSSLLDDGIVNHLAFRAPLARATQVGKVSVLAHDDDQLSAFLAAHLAKHAMPPLLWLIDFDALWSKLDPSQRDRAREAARAARAHRYLEWALERRALLRAAVAGSDPACAALGFRGERRADGHNAMRVASLSATPLDAFRVFSAWAIPRDLLGGRREFATRLAQRLRKLLHRQFGTSRVYTETDLSSVASSDASTRAISLDGHELAGVARALSEKGMAFWIRATGASMNPAVTDGALIRLAPLGNRRLRPGDVVLAQLGDGSCVVHRVRRVTGSVVHLQGDANLRADSPVSDTDVLAIADALCVHGRVRPIPAARIARAANTIRAWRLQVSRRGRRGGGVAPVRAEGAPHAG